MAALQLGEAARNDAILRKCLEQDLRELEHNLERDTLSCAFVLVADNILEFKLALPRNKLTSGEFHDKFGIFTDAEGNQISFKRLLQRQHSRHTQLRIHQGIRSWQPELLALVQDDIQRFERAVETDHDPNVRVFDLPQPHGSVSSVCELDPRPYPNPILGGLGGSMNRVT
jgi:hypothetical protein